MRLICFGVVGVLTACGQSHHGPDLTPPDPPTQQDYGAPTGRTLALTWNNSTDRDFALTLAVRYEAGVPPNGQPRAGVTPMPGDLLGAGRVVYVGKDPRFVDASLPNGCNAYTYQLWSADTSGNWSVVPAQLDVPRGAVTRLPLSAPSQVTAASIEGDVQLAWTNPPADSGWNELRVVRKFSAAPTSPVDGVVVFTGKGSGAAEPLEGMGAGPWVYGVFACNGCGLCNPSPATAVFTWPIATDGGGEGDGGTDGGSPEDGGSGLLTPTAVALQLSGDGKTVLLSWANPAQVTQVKVLRTLNAAPLGPGDSDAALIFQGSSTNATERVDKLFPNTSGSPHLWFYRVYGCKSASCETAGAGATLALTVGQALRGGGYTLFWRHSTATVCADQTQLGPADNTPQPDWWKSCDKTCSSAYARQLDTLQSPNETATIHSGFATRGITVGKVLSSEFCRAVETANGFNFGPAVEPSQVLTYFVYDEAQRCTNTLALLNVGPAPGTNTAMVSHAGFTCPTLDSLAWGEAAIYRPSATGSAVFIGRVPWNGWLTLP